MEGGVEAPRDAPARPEKEYFGELTEEGRRLLEVKDCPIKKEYRVEEWKAPEGSGRGEEVAEKEEEDEEEEGGGGGGRKKDGKWRNQKRAKKNQKKKNPWLGNRPGMVPRLGPELCPAFAKGTCKYGDDCRLNHDVEKFLKIKPPNVSSYCHVFATYGACLDGVKCRFSDAHTTDEGRTNVINDELWALHKEERTSKWPSDDLLTRVGRNQYPLERAGAVTELYDAAFKEREQGGRKKQEETAESAEPETKRPKAAEANWSALAPEDRPPLDLSNKLILAPLTTIGNLPFRRVCVELGADVTIGEMAVAENILKGKQSEWVLMKRHPCEKIFGVQIAVNKVFDACKVAQLIDQEVAPNFIDINCGCPIDVMTSMGMGSALLERITRLRDLCHGLSRTLEQRLPFTIKVRTGKKTANPTIHRILPELAEWGCAGVTMHGRSWDQRYTKEADWDYIRSFAEKSPVPVFGNGDVYDYVTWKHHMEHDKVSSVMFARGAIIKPWIFTECKERRMWDISSGERLDILRKFTNYGLEHWGSDWMGVEKTRNFMLQTLSFMHRYVPYGLLERYPVEMWHRPIPFQGRDDLETLMGSPYSEDWVRISEMLLGKVPDGFRFEPKHSSNSYSQSVLPTQSLPKNDGDEW